MKLKIMYGSLPTWTLLLSPVHTFTPVLLIPLFVREIAYEIQNGSAYEKMKRDKKSQASPEKSTMESVIVHQATEA